MKLETATPELAVAFVTAAEVRRTLTGPPSGLLAGRLAAIRALRTLTDATRPQVRCGEDGRPAARIGDAWVELSTAQLDGCAAAVATMAGCTVGIALVRADSVMPHERRLFLSAAEQCQARLCDPSVLWAVKEAAFKAISGTAGIPFTDVGLQFGDRGRVIAVHARGETRRAGSMIAAPWPGYRAAVVWVANASQKESA